MSSPAKRHFQRVSAATRAVAGSSAPTDQGTATQYELMLLKLAEDKRRLKDIQSIERKAEVKAQLLPEYKPWIDGVLEGDTGQQDDVLMTVFVWAIDIGDFVTAIKVADYAIAHKLVMPDQYKRDVATVLAEEIADQNLKAIAAEQSADINAMLIVDELTRNLDMPDEVRAKLYKAIGYAYRAANVLEKARDCLIRALELNDKVGVKKDIERLETLIKNSSGTDTTA